MRIGRDDVLKIEVGRHRESPMSKQARADLACDSGHALHHLRAGASMLAVPREVTVAMIVVMIVVVIAVSGLHVVAQAHPLLVAAMTTIENVTTAVTPGTATTTAAIDATGSALVARMIVTAT